MGSIRKALKAYMPPDLHSFGKRIVNAHYVSKQTKVFKRVVKEYLATHSIAKLQLGSQNNTLEGWLNTDRYVIKELNIYYLNATEKFQIPDNSFDYIFCEELIEHIDYNEGRRMLQECLRILKPGGRVRIGTPDLASFIKLYNSKNNKLHAEYNKWIVDHFCKDIKIYSSVFVINNLFRNWGHKFIYDYPTLADSLKRAGFVNTKRWQEGKSSDKHLSNIEQHGISSQNMKFRNFESFFIEAEKPPKK